MAYTLAGGMQFVLNITGGDTPMSNFVGEFRGAVDNVTLNFDHDEFPSIEFKGMILEHKLGSTLKDKESMPVRVIRIGNPKKK
jgi:hypothetical protein